MRYLALIALGAAVGYALHPEPDPWLYTEAAGERWCMVAQHRKVNGVEYPGRETYMIDVDDVWIRVFEKCD